MTDEAEPFTIRIDERLYVHTARRVTERLRGAQTVRSGVIDIGPIVQCASRGGSSRELEKDGRLLDGRGLRPRGACAQVDHAVMRDVTLAASWSTHGPPLAFSFRARPPNGAP